MIKGDDAGREEREGLVRGEARQGLHERSQCIERRWREQTGFGVLLVGPGKAKREAILGRGRDIAPVLPGDGLEDETTAAREGGERDLGAPALRAKGGLLDDEGPAACLLHAQCVGPLSAIGQRRITAQRIAAYRQGPPARARLAQLQLRPPPSNLYPT